MPIKDESVYPGGSTRSKEWLAIRQSTLARAGDCCELCFVPNGAWIEREVSGRWFESQEASPNSIKIVLTIAHINQDPGDSRDVNLLALCQRCHNRIDQPYRQQNAGATRRAKKARGDLVGGNTGMTPTHAPTRRARRENG